MKYCLLISFLLVPMFLQAQCANTAYGSFTCVQSPVPVQSSPTAAVNTTALSFAANTTAGNGVMIFASFCTSNPCANNGTPTNITVTDDVMDTGFQPCANNGSIPFVRYWYCWWLPSVGAARVFTLHANATFSNTLWIAEIAGACNTGACIGTDVPAVYCMGPCGPQIVTNFTNVLVIGMGYAANTTLTPASGWRTISSGTPGDGIASYQAIPGPYTPGWTNAIMLQGLAASIKSTSSIYTQITVPSMPVF